MAYTFSVNNTPATAGFSMYLLVSTLVTAGWVVKASGDGVASYSAASGASVTSGNTGALGFDNTNAWVRIQAPAVNGGSIVNQTREWTFQRGTTNNKGWRFKYSASAGFTGGSPSATVTPSATDEVIMVGAGTDASPTPTANWFHTDGVYRWHIVCGGAAEFYSFNAFATLAGAITLYNGMFMDACAPGSYPSTDVDPCVVYCSATAASLTYNAQTTFAHLGGILSTVTNPALSRAWLGAVVNGPTSVTGSNVAIALIPYGSTSGATFGSVTTIGTNPFSLKDDMLPAWWMRTGVSTTPTGVKGCSTLFTYGSVVRQTLDTADVLSTRDRIYIGSTAQGCIVWAPWSGALVSI